MVRFSSSRIPLRLRAFAVAFCLDHPMRYFTAVTITEQRAIYLTNIDTGETKKLAMLPPRATVASVNANETLAAGTFIEGTAGDD